MVYASMRPQHITAENCIRAQMLAAVLDASMRPQHITAENVTDLSTAVIDFMLQ